MEGSIGFVRDQTTPRMQRPRSSVQSPEILDYIFRAAGYAPRQRYRYIQLRMHDDTYRTTYARHKDYVTTCIHAAHARTHARAQWLASMEWRLLLLRLLVDIPSRSPYRWVAARW